jgi:hypothetical protein
MSVTAWLQQISASGLEIIKNDLEIFEQVIRYLVPVNSDMPLIADIAELLPSQDAYPWLVEAVREVQGFYQTAAEKGYGVIFAVG